MPIQERFEKAAFDTKKHLGNLNKNSWLKLKQEMWQYYETRFKKCILTIQQV